MSYKCAVFDMDGTILDTLLDIYNSINYALKENGFPERSIEEVRMFVGNGLMRLVELAVPEGTPPEKIKKVGEMLIPYYIAHSGETTRVYPGIIELLKKLREAGIKTAVVSNKTDAGVQDLVKIYFDGLFDAAMGENEKAGIKKKPNPEMTMNVLGQLGMKPEDAVYIGDSDVDIATARNSGLDEILVDWGFRGHEFLEEQGAKRIVSSTDEVYDIIIK